MSRLRWVQIKAVVLLEMKKTFLAKRSLWVYLLALSPLVLFLGHAATNTHQRRVRSHLAAQCERRLTQKDLAAITEGMKATEVIRLLGKPPVRHAWGPAGRGTAGAQGIELYQYTDGENDLFVDICSGQVTGVHLREGCGPGKDSILFASIFQFFYLRLVIVFGCLGIFMNLFRGELLDRSLHFYFLAPIRREVMMMGKYLAGLVAATIIFTTSVTLQMAILAVHLDTNLLNGNLFQNAHIAAYLGTTVLACVGYGSLFLAVGLFFRNPVHPAATVLLWEAVNPLLPSLPKKFSVIYYLKSLCPVDVPVSPDATPLFRMLTSNADPIAAPTAIFGVITVATAILVISAFRVRRLEINYTTE